jgi:CDGSH-type Zn-finger protein
MLLLVKIITITRIRERCRLVVSLRKPLTSRRRTLEKTMGHALCVCGKGGHLTKDCSHHKTQIDGQQKKAVNVTIGKNNGDEIDPSGYANLPFVF